LPPRTLVSVDPGARLVYFAVFKDGRLVRVGQAENPGDVDLPYGGEWVFETPRRYKNRSNTHRDLARLEARNDRFIWRVKDAGGSYEKAYPSVWKGNVPKGIHHRRAAKKLTSKELELLPPLEEGYDHNLWDAVALGLWKLGRMRRGR